MKKHEAKHIIAVLMNAQRSGKEAGENKLNELSKVGPRWAVKNESDNKIVGTMLDVCGCTAIHLDGRSKIVRAFKALGNPDRYGDLAINGISISKNDYRVGYGLRIHLINRQELSVQERAVDAFCDYCIDHGLECSWSSRID